MNKKLLFIFILSAILSGCTTTVSQRHSYIARDPKTGDMSLFRVTITGNAQFTAAQYDAGWRNTEAVDEIFNDVKAEVGDNNKKLYDKVYDAQYKQVDKICADIGNLTNCTDFNDKFDELNNVMSLQRKLKYTQIYGNPNYPSEKFLLVLSSDPTKIYDEISAVVKRQTNEGALLDTFGSFVGSKRSDEKKKDDDSVTALKNTQVDMQSITANDVPSAQLAMEKCIIELQNYLGVTE